MKTHPTKPISVALVSDAVYPYHRGGKETRYHELATRLRHDLAITVYSMHWWPERQRTKVIDGVEHRAICPLVPLYSGGRRSLWEAIVFALACLRMITRPFDVVEADHVSHLQLFTLRLVTRLRRKPLVVTWYEVWGRDYWEGYLGRLPGRIAWWIERRAMRLPDEILVVSAGTADRLRAEVGNSIPIRVVQPAIDLGLIANTAPADVGEAAELLFVGRLLKHKGVHLLIDALTRLEAGRQVRLLVVGSGPERENLMSQVAASGLDGRVRFRSDVAEHREILALMRAADVFVLPSVREGFGIAVLEALACGAAVVTTSHPDNNAVHLVARSRRGYLAEPTVDALAAAISRALADQAGQNRPTEAWLTQYDWGPAAEEFASVLAGAVAARSRGRHRFREGTNGAVLAGQGQGAS